MNGDEDFYLPARERTRPEQTPEEDAADLEYLRNSLFNAIKIPEEYRMSPEGAKILDIEATFEELGIKNFRALKKMLLVRTEPLPKKIGLIYVPPKLASFYGELPHLQNIYAMVLSAGPKADCRPTDRVVFSRLYFARWQTMEDGTVVGWIDEANVYGRA